MDKDILDNNKEWLKFEKNLAELVQLEVVAGLFDTTGIPDANSNVAFRGFVNEYGDSEHGIPARPFMRQAQDKNKSEFERIQNIMVGKVIDGKSTAKQYFEVLGQSMQAKIKQSITELREPPNSPKTIELKGSSNPLIDSGEMRNSVDYKVRKT